MASASLWSELLRLKRHRRRPGGAAANLSNASTPSRTAPGDFAPGCGGEPVEWQRKVAQGRSLAAHREHHAGEAVRWRGGSSTLAPAGSGHPGLLEVELAARSAAQVRPAWRGRTWLTPRPRASARRSASARLPFRRGRAARRRRDGGSAAQRTEARQQPRIAAAQGSRRGDPPPSGAQPTLARSSTPKRAGAAAAAAPGFGVAAADIGLRLLPGRCVTSSGGLEARSTRLSRAPSDFSASRRHLRRRR